MAKIIGFEYCNGGKSAVYIESTEGRQKFVLERRGRWIKRPDERICPFCNDHYSYFGGKEKNYCSNCGAKMDGEGNNNAAD